jgi:arylformamidase
MTDDCGIDWQDALANADYIAGGAEYPARWAATAAAFRDHALGQFDLPYGRAPRAVLDLFRPAQTPKGLVVFVHGGYWLRFDKSYWSHLAAGPLAQGWAVAMPSYTLAPDVRISAITQSVAQAIAQAALHVDGPIRLVGHSAGGHLVSRMVCDDSPVAPEALARVQGVVSVSGVHDLRPLLCNTMNETLRLDRAEAAAESPALRAPRAGIAVTAWVGACERPEFLRQSALLAESWTRQGVSVPLIVEPARHHFDVIDGLSLPDHPLTRAVIGA